MDEEYLVKLETDNSKEEEIKKEADSEEAQPNQDQNHPKQNQAQPHSPQPEFGRDLETQQALQVVFKSEQESDAPPSWKRRLGEDHSSGSSQHHEEERCCSPQPPVKEAEGHFGDSLVGIDFNNCDLHFKVSRDQCSGCPLTTGGVAHRGAGARAGSGVCRGRVCYEMKVIEETPGKHVPGSQPDMQAVRVGWSLGSCRMQLGEEAFSYGYEGTGKKLSDGQCEDYGEAFGENDVIGCYIDFDSAEEVQMAFSRNRKWLGVAFRVSKRELWGRDLFPHVLVKNCAVEFNFGHKGALLCSQAKGYTFIQNVGEDRRRSAVEPASKSDCERLRLPEAGQESCVVVKEEPADPAAAAPPLPGPWEVETSPLEVRLLRQAAQIEELRAQLEEKDAECRWMREELLRLWEVVHSGSHPSPNSASGPIPIIPNIPTSSSSSSSPGRSGREHRCVVPSVHQGFPDSLRMERCWSSEVSIRPDVPLRHISATNDKILLRMSNSRPDRYGALVFRSVISQELYEEWVTHTNWDGSRGKWGVPRNVRNFVTQRVRDRFPNMSNADKKAVKERVNECLRARRKTIVPIPSLNE